MLDIFGRLGGFGKATKSTGVIDFEHTCFGPFSCRDRRYASFPRGSGRSDSRFSYFRRFSKRNKALLRMHEHRCLQTAGKCLLQVNYHVIYMCPLNQVQKTGRFAGAAPFEDKDMPLKAPFACARHDICPFTQAWKLQTETPTHQCQGCPCKLDVRTHRASATPSPPCLHWCE